MGGSGRSALIIENNLQNDVKYFKIPPFLFVFVPPLSTKAYTWSYSTNLNIPWGKYICSFPNAQSPCNIEATLLDDAHYAVMVAVDDPVTQVDTP